MIDKLIFQDLTPPMPSCFAPFLVEKVKPIIAAGGFLKRNIGILQIQMGYLTKIKLIEGN